MASLWVFKDIALIIIQCLQCEKFYIANERAKIACILLVRNENCPTEVPLRHSLDKDIRRIFYPFHILLLLVLSPKYTIKDNYITTNGTIRNLFSIFIECIAIDFVFINYNIECVYAISLIMLLKKYLNAWMNCLFKIYSHPSIELALFLWVSKDILLLIAQSMESEKFYIANEEAKATCMQLMKNKNCSRHEQRLYKQVLQTNRTFSRISACGFFYIDAQSTISLIGLLTGYVCVLLQFAFL
ncbi:uncharacterized protein LOC111351057 [Spodoptera litura]|uniref:Uncharacterized protein LOC111351057 n=1 Tax=Spodoptera litura TaxID=69820 RepID=A0A9J7IKY0_SPOLT|nr:uncharacterized protein LOC111351057 [Spodoptera litura]